LEAYRAVIKIREKVKLSPQQAVEAYKVLMEIKKHKAVPVTGH
jgi:hypothetical protein